MILSLGVMKAVKALDKAVSKPGVDYAAKRADTGRYDSTGSRYVSSGQRMGDAPGAAGQGREGRNGDDGKGSSSVSGGGTPDNNYRHLKGGVKGGSSSGNTGIRSAVMGAMGSSRMANGLPDTSANNKAGRMAGWSMPMSRRNSRGSGL